MSQGRGNRAAAGADVGGVRRAAGPQRIAFERDALHEQLRFRSGDQHCRVDLEGQPVELLLPDNVLRWLARRFAADHRFPGVLLVRRERVTKRGQIRRARKAQHMAEQQLRVRLRLPHARRR
ncbi:hypothetical protein D3C81_1434390 [compost metagenome]